MIVNLQLFEVLRNQCSTTMLNDSFCWQRTLASFRHLFVSLEESRVVDANTSTCQIELFQLLIRRVSHGVRNNGLPLLKWRLVCNFHAICSKHLIPVHLMGLERFSFGLNRFTLILGVASCIIGLLYQLGHIFWHNFYHIPFVHDLHHIFLFQLVKLLSQLLLVHELIEIGVDVLLVRTQTSFPLSRHYRIRLVIICRLIRHRWRIANFLHLCNSRPFLIAAFLKQDVILRVLLIDIWNCCMSRGRNDISLVLFNMVYCLIFLASFRANLGILFRVNSGFENTIISLEWLMDTLGEKHILVEPLNAVIFNLVFAAELGSRYEVSRETLMDFSLDLLRSLNVFSSIGIELLFLVKSTVFGLLSLGYFIQRILNVRQNSPICLFSILMALPRSILGMLSHLDDSLSGLWLQSIHLNLWEVGSSNHFSTMVYSARFFIVSIWINAIRPRFGNIFPLVVFQLLKTLRLFTVTIVFLFIISLEDLAESNNCSISYGGNWRSFIIYLIVLRIPISKPKTCRLSFCHGCDLLFHVWTNSFATTLLYYSKVFNIFA